MKKKTGCLKYIVVAVVVIVCNLNLPPNDVAGFLDTSELEQESRADRVVKKLFAKGLTSDLVADWKYHNFIVFKMATSERLDLVALGLPFCKWQVGAAEERSER